MSCKLSFIHPKLSKNEEPLLFRKHCYIKFWIFETSVFGGYAHRRRSATRRFTKSQLCQRAFLGILKAKMHRDVSVIGPKLHINPSNTQKTTKLHYFHDFVRKMRFRQRLDYSFFIYSSTVGLTGCLIYTANDDETCKQIRKRC